MWSDWSTCEADFCSYDNITRTRQCNNPAPLNGGLNCDGNNTEISWCYNNSCPGMCMKISVVVGLRYKSVYVKGINDNYGKL